MDETDGGQVTSRRAHQRLSDKEFEFLLQEPTIGAFRDQYVACLNEARRARESEAELLEALKALVSGREGQPGYNEIFRRAQAAIAKAEGK